MGMRTVFDRRVNADEQTKAFTDAFPGPPEIYAMKYPFTETPDGGGETPLDDIPDLTVIFENQLV